MSRADQGAVEPPPGHRRARQGATRAAGPQPGRVRSFSPLPGGLRHVECREVVRSGESYHRGRSADTGRQTGFTSCKTSDPKWRDRQVFTGEYRHSVDEKGRIAVPAKFRVQLDSGAFVARWLDACLAIFPKSEFEDLAAKVGGPGIAAPSG